MSRVPRMRQMWILAVTAGLWSPAVYADTILLRDVRGVDARAVTTELDASGNIVRQNIATDAQQAVPAQPFTHATRVNAPLPGGTASALIIQESIAGPFNFIGTGAAQLEPMINSSSITSAGSEAGSFYGVTFQLLEPYRYHYNTFVERLHPEGFPSFSETRLSDSTGGTLHHLELFETGGFLSLSRSGTLRPGVYTLEGNARVFEFGGDVFGRAQYQVELSLTPVPEPGSMLLVGTGLAALVARTRKRRSTRA